VGDAYVAELLHFRDCVVDGAECRTPPEQARRDIELLRDLFLARATAPTASPGRPVGTDAR
jgi:hypothetical protein